MKTIKLKGLTMAPSQIWGNVRIVPLLKQTPIGDLRLWKRNYDENRAAVNLGGPPRETKGPLLLLLYPTWIGTELVR